MRDGTVLPGDVVPRDAQPCRQDDVGRRGERGGRDWHGRESEGLRHGCPRHLPTPQRARQDRGVLHVAAAPQQRVHLHCEPFTVPRGQVRVVVQPGDRLGRAGERVRDVPRRREYPREALRRGTGVPQQLQVPVGRAELVGQPPEREETCVGVAALREPPEEDGQQLALDRRAPADTLGEGGDVPHRAGGVAVADRREARTCGLGRERDVLA